MSKNKSSIIEAAAKEAEAVRNLAIRRVQERVLENIAPKIERSVLDALANPSSSSAALEAVAAKMVKEAEVSFGEPETAKVNFSIEPGGEVDVHIPANQEVAGSDADILIGPDEPSTFDEPAPMDDFGFGDEEGEDLFGDPAPVEDEAAEEAADDLEDLFGEEEAEDEAADAAAEEEAEEEVLGDSLNRNLSKAQMAEAVLRTNARRARVIREWVDYVDNKRELGRAYLAARALGQKIAEDAKRLGVDPMKDKKLKAVYVGTVKEVNTLLESIKERKQALTQIGGQMRKRRTLKEEEMLDADLGLGLDDMDLGDDMADEMEMPEAPEAPADPADAVERLADAADALEDLVDRLEDDIEALLGDLDEEGEEEDEEDEEEEEKPEPVEESMNRERVIEARRRAEARRVLEARRERAARLVEARRRKELEDARRRKALAEAIRRRRARRFESEAADTAVETIGGEFDSTDLGDAHLDHDLEPEDQLTPAYRSMHADAVSDVRPTPAGTYEARLRRELAASKLREAKLRVAAQIAANEKLSTAKKRQIVEAVDRAKSIAEVKATYRAARVALAEAFAAPARKPAAAPAPEVNEEARRAEIVAEARRRLARRRAAAKLQEARERRSLNEGVGRVRDTSTTSDAWARIAFKKN
jgi:hypothetical protein